MLEPLTEVLAVARPTSSLPLQRFGGMTDPEMAEALLISEATEHRDLRLVHAWLRRQLAPSPPGTPEPS